ncbi:hypothetical protein PP749_gp002 [Rhizobium phage RHEph22]|uniref:Uncharacterized protein n=1 Tax=Rhizobium phage RHEph22 TaxID=2836135 RepID=A0AAE8AVW1_9CAUD|nr:hypothetical protein PP749_gp002 [Rhizobium phage RHEph22]QXV74675.1 hypothetical protein [Rhizobium phage RHEph22]
MWNIHVSKWTGKITFWFDDGESIPDVQHIETLGL